ncbi:hypothetical protein PTKIN_Ptkin12aG0180700 [Pterospermum kingtungense]
MEGLSLGKDEDGGLDLDVDYEFLQIQSAKLELCLGGRFLSDKPINFIAMRNRVADIWRPGRGVTIKNLGDNLFLFQFYHIIDLRRVLAGGPWYFDNQLLICHHMKSDDDPFNLDLFTVPFWIQVHDLPSGYMSEVVGKQLGDFIEKFLEYDGNNNSIV